MADSKALFGKLKKKLAESAKRFDGDDLLVKAEIIASMRFGKQQDLANDPSRFIGVTCGRRSGKSTGALTIALERCLRKAYASWCIIGLTRPSIKRIYWRTLKKLNQDLALNLEFNETELTVTFTNGAILQFLGAENASEIEKIRGNAYDGVIIDECKSFSIVVFEELIEDVIRPALSDRLGCLILIGTPGRHLGGAFFNATHFPSPLNDNGRPHNVRYGSKEWAKKGFGWSSHHWDARDNHAMPGIWLDFLKIKEDKGWKDETPTWCREYLGLWIADHSNRVFRYDPDKCDWNESEGLPLDHEWNYVMGLDPGFDDAFGFAVLAYSTTHPDLYVVYSFKQSGLNVTAAAAMIKSIEADYGGIDVKVGDRSGLGKMVFDELATQHDIYIERTEKKEKDDLIELVNDDLDAGRVKIERSSPLAGEMVEHRWDYRSGKRVESSKTKNDACDAFVYAFRWCEHRRYRPKPIKTAQYSEEWYAELERAEIEAVEKRHTEVEDKLNKDWW